MDGIRGDSPGWLLTGRAAGCERQPAQRRFKEKLGKSRLKQKVRPARVCLKNEAADETRSDPSRCGTSIWHLPTR